MKKALIFAGTTEGRLIAEQLADAGILCTVCVATDYGESLIEAREGLTVHAGRLDKAAMVGLMVGNDPAGPQRTPDENAAPAQNASGEPLFAVIVDATHPFATVASREIRAAAEEAGIPYLRLARATGDETLRALAENAREGAGDAGEKPSGGAQVVIVSSVEEAAAYLDGTEGPILLTTGSKELPVIVERIQDKERLYARVLPLADSLRQCLDAGLKGRQIIAMQGPFTEALNVAMIRQIGAKWLLTKQTGRIGGFEEKIRAAQIDGANVVVIRNPETDESGRMSYAEVVARLEEIFDVKISSGGEACETAPETFPASAAVVPAAGPEAAGSLDMALVGIGVGDPAYMTEAVIKAVSEAEIVFGAPRILDSLKDVPGLTAAGKVFIPFYQADKILEYLTANPAYRRVAVAFSGDTGFYSGASSMMSAIRQAGSPYPVRILCGISAPVYFASKIGEPWQDMTLLSAHGRGCNVVGQVRRNRRSFLLCSGLESVKEIGRDLDKAFRDIEVTYGYQLSYPEEKIARVAPADLEALTDEGLYVLLIDNPHADECPVVPGIPDDAFLRDKAPMTKEEIRALSLCKLRPGRKAVIYDIGAGSGSVSVEAALLCPEGWVYAVEQNDTAVELLEKNKAHFAVANMTVIKAKAPEGLEDLPAPTHAFIGGSSGNLKEILETILAKNPAVRVVINAVTLETLAEAQAVLSALPFSSIDYTQIQASRAETLGRYHLMKAQNPVFIISAEACQ